MQHWLTELKSVLASWLGVTLWSSIIILDSVVRNQPGQDGYSSKVYNIEPLPRAGLVQKYISYHTRHTSDLLMVHVEIALPFPGAISNFPFHFSSCLNKDTVSVALGVPWSGSAPPSSSA